MRKKIYRQITSWLLILCISFTSCEWSSVAWAAGNDVKNDTEQTTEEAQDPDAVEEFEDSGEIDTDLADPEELEKEEIVEERTPNSTTWQLSDGRKMTEFYSSDVRYEDEEGSLVDYDTSLIAVDSELTVKGEELEGYAYVNAQGDMKHYIPEEIGQETPLRMENGEYSLEVTPLFGQSGEAYEIDISADMISAEEGSVSTDAEPPADMGLSILGSEDNAFREIEELSSVQVEEEKTTDIYGEEEEKNTAAVYTSEDESFELEYVPFETGVKENIILNEKPESNVWQFALTLGGGITARKNAVTQGISFYALDEKEEEVLVGGIQTPYMNDATEEHYSEAITYDLEEADGSEGTYILTMTVDPDYLEDEDTVYPVTIDPSYTWTGGSAVYDVYVLSKSTYADMNFYDSSTTGMFAGRTNANGYERTYIAFNGLANKVSGYSVASAKLTIYETGGGTAGETVQAHTVTAAWDKSTLTWNNRPSYSGTVLSSFTNTAESYHAGTLDITSYARKVANGSSDYGIMLRTKDEAVSQYAKFYGSRHSSTSYRPKLVVTYYDKPTTASSVKLASAYLKKGASVTVTWEGIESVALSKVQYRIASITDDGKAFINTELAPYASNPSLGNTASGTGTIDTSTFGEGYFRLYVRGMDKYGSVGTGKATNFILDSTVPTLSSASLTPATSTTSYSSNLTPVINWSGAADRFFKKVQYSVDGTSYTQIGTTESGSFTVPSGKITTSGKHTIKVRAVDKCSNASTAKTLYYYCDITKPTGSITVQDADGDDSGKYQITLAASDANSGVRSVTLKLSGETLDSDETLYSGTAGSSVIFDPSEYPEGTYTLTLTVTDKCGNSTTVTKTFSPIDLADWAPQNLTVQDKINYKTLLKWDRHGEDALPDSISYEVYRSTSADFTPDESTLAASGLKTCYWCEPNVNYGKTYYYKVRAVRSNSSGTVTATGSFSAEVSSTVVSADEYEKFLGIKDYWGYQSLETPVGTGQVEESKGNFVYQQEDVTLPSSELEFGITRTYNSQSTAKTAFGNGWDHNFNLEILRVCDTNGEDTDSYVFKDGTGTIEKLELQENGSYLSGSTKELQLFESEDAEGTVLNLDEVQEVTWSYRMEDKSQTCWYFNSSGQAIAITEPTGTWMLLHYDEKQGMLSQVEASTGKVLDFEYQDASDGDHVLVKKIVLPDESTLEYAYDGLQLQSMTRKSTDGSQSVVYAYTWTDGNVTAIKDAEENPYQISYDSSDRVSALTLPDGEKTVLTYDTSAKKTAITKQTSGGKTILTENVTWNSNGNIVSYTDPQGNVTTYTYEDNCLTSTTVTAAWETLEDGKVVSHTETRTSTTDYDSLGNITQDTAEDGSITTYTYGDENNPNLITAAVTEKEGTTLENTVSTYDEAGRITSEEDLIQDTETLYTYTDSEDSDELQVSVTEKLEGNTVSISEEGYDAEGNLLTESSTAGEITLASENVYDTMGNLLESSSSDGSRTVYTYDFLGRLTKTEVYDQDGELAQTTETSYYPNGQVKSETAADGSVSSYTYDSRNRVLKKTISAGGNSRTWTTAYGYGDVAIQNGQGTGTTTIQNAAKVTETDPEGAESVSWTDGLGQTVRVTSGGLHQDSIYDRSGQNYLTVASTSDGTITNKVLTLYDENGNQTDTIQQPGYEAGSFTVTSESICTSQSYDKKGNVLTETDALGNRITYTYDDSSRLTTVKEGEAATSYQYDTDSDGNSKTTVTRANGSTSVTVEDGGGRTLYVLDSGDGQEIRTSYQYDENGLLTCQTQADGSTVNYEYDSLRRSSKVTSKNKDGETQHVTEYEYDSADRVTAMLDYGKEDGTLSPLRYTGYTYNSFGELTGYWEVDGTVSPSAAQKSAHLIQYSYHGDGSIASVSYAENGNGVTALHYSYNSNKQLEKITADLEDGQSRTLCEYQYTADGKVSSRKDYEDFAGSGDGYVQRTYAYDAFDRVLTMTYNENSDSDAEESHSYQYDKASRIIHEETTLSWSGQSETVSEVHDYTYDEYGQLVKSVLLDRNQVSTTTEYTYDLVGNRLKQTEVMFAEEENAQLKQAETTYAYNTLDQLVSSREEEALASAPAEAASAAAYTYDAVGNLISVVDSVEGTENTYTYDPLGQMTSCQIQKDGTVLLEQENAYNGDGQRISRMENDSQTVYFYQDGTLLMTEDGNGELDSFYYLGISGNPLALMESGSDTASYYLYQKDAQGSTRAVTGADGTCAEWYSYTDFGETTIHEELDGFKNVICYTGGVYDESTELYYLNARYYNPETGRFLSRDTYRGENAKPNTLHLYLYCANDPVNYVDPSGHVPAVVIAAAVVGAVIGAVYAAYKSHKMLGYVKTKWVLGGALIGGGAGALAGYLGVYVAKVLGVSGAKVSGRLTQKAYSSWKRAEEACRALTKGVANKRFSTPYGTRVPDSTFKFGFLKNKIGIAEAKYGYQGLSSTIKKEIQKDAWLLKTKKVAKVQWHFYWSAVSKSGGPSGPLLKELINNGFEVIFH